MFTCLSFYHAFRLTKLRVALGCYCVYQLSSFSKKQVDHNRIFNVLLGIDDGCTFEVKL